MKTMSYLLISLTVWAVPAKAQILLVDYGPDHGSNVYNTSVFSGWDQVTISPTTAYMDAGENSGTALPVVPPDSSQFSNFTCITGNPRPFVRGERLLISWYNNTDSQIEFNPLLSFLDEDNPVNEAGELQWFIVGLNENFYLEPSEVITTYYDITDETNAAVMIPPSAGNHSLLNICSNSMQPGLILDKIEIGLSDTIAPAVPQNLTVVKATSNSISLQWDAAADNPGGDGLSHYDIFMNGLHFGVSQTNQFTAYLLEAGTQYMVQVRAVDNNRNASALSPALQQQTTGADYGTQLLDPQTALVYMGAFKLPEEGIGSDFNYMDGDPAYFPLGDPENTDDFPGSIFIAGDATHRMVAEISIPEPVISPDKNLDDLNTSTYLQNFADIASPNIQYEEWGWKRGPALEYLPAQAGQSQGYLYSCHGEYYAWSGQRFNSYGACNTDLSNPSPVGGWLIGPPDGMQAPHYMTIITFNFALPTAINNHLLVAGGSRPGNLHNGPSLVAYSPWNDGTPLPPNNTYLNFTPLLLYEDDYGTAWLNGHGYCDYWYGGSWVNAGTKQSIVVSGAKGRGREWYGYNNGESTFNIMMNIPTPEEPEDHGPRQSFAQAMLLFYNPQEILDVASGSLQTWEPQPYAVLQLEEQFYYPNNHNPEYISEFKGAGGMAYDSDRNLLYVFEKGVTGNDNSVSIVHVWRVETQGTSIGNHQLNMPSIHYNGIELCIFHKEFSGAAKVEIFSASGMLIHTYTSQNSRHHCKRLHLSAGFYLVQVKIGDLFAIQKFIVNP